MPSVRINHIRINLERASHEELQNMYEHTAERMQEAYLDLKVIETYAYQRFGAVAVGGELQG